MDGVEPSFAAVVRIELEAGQPSGEPRLKHQTVKDSLPGRFTVEVEICRELLPFFVKDIQGPVLFVNEIAASVGPWAPGERKLIREYTELIWLLTSRFPG